MTRDDVLEYCAGMPGAVEDYPFGDEVAVFKVGGKMFALVMLEGEPGFVNLKCDPDLALELRARYTAVEPSYPREQATLEQCPPRPFDRRFRTARDDRPLLHADRHSTAPGRASPDPNRLTTHHRLE